MKSTNYFELPRFWLLLKMEWFKSKNAILLTFAVAFGLLLTGDLTAPIFDASSSPSHEEDYAFSLLAIGFVLSSLAFQDLKNTLRRSQYLSLPASTFEKFFSMWLLTSIGWILAFTLTFVLFTWVSNGLCHIIYRHIDYPAFTPFSAIPLHAMGYYVVLQAAFLVGAVHFRGYAFLKTLLTLLVAGLVFGTVAYCLMSDMFEGTGECLTEEHFVNMPSCQFWSFVTRLFWYVLVPLCWVITYFGLKEQEV